MLVLNWHQSDKRRDERKTLSQPGSDHLEETPPQYCRVRVLFLVEV